MKTFWGFCLLINLAATLAVFPADKVPPRPLYTVDLSKFISQELNINPAGTLTFLTEKTLAVSICRNLRCSLATFDLGSGKPRMIASRADEFPHYSSLFRTSDGHLILDNAPTGTERGALILDDQLHPQLLIAQAAGIRQQHISTTGETFVKQDRNDWVAYKMERPRQRILSGTGTILSISDDAVAYFDDGTVHVEGMDGTSLGSFASPPPKTLNFGSYSITPKSIPTLRFLGRNRLWYENGSDERILDFNGKPIQTLERPDGWGFRIGQSSDGSRILYDRYTRHIPLAQKIEEEAIAAATMGMGVGDEEPNGEMVLVIDTRSGKPCFEWNSNTNLLVAGQLHADIDPSGKLIAIMTPTALSIYSLPEVCVAQ